MGETDQLDELRGHIDRVEAPTRDQEQAAADAIFAEVRALYDAASTGSANAMFRGDPSRHDPEDYFLTAISSCHMLSYLALCARRGIDVIAYEDDARGTLVLDGDGGRFSVVTLHPKVTIRSGDLERAKELHHRAHQECFIANSCSVPIRCEATVTLSQR